MPSLESGERTPITDSPIDEFYPRWSPDGAEIAFYRGVSEDEFAVMLARVHGGTPEELVTSTRLVCNPEWSPDGLAIAFEWKRTPGLDSMDL